METRTEEEVAQWPADNPSLPDALLMRQIVRPAFLPDNGVKAQVKTTWSRPATPLCINRAKREARILVSRLGSGERKP